MIDLEKITKRKSLNKKGEKLIRNDPLTKMLIQDLNEWIAIIHKVISLNVIYSLRLIVFLLSSQFDKINVAATKLF